MLFALALVIFICLLGMVMDSAANIIVVGPVLVDVMIKAGYPDVQAALVVVVGFLIGSVTPPWALPISHPAPSPRPGWKVWPSPCCLI